MVADWIVIYGVLFVLAAAVVGRVPAEGWRGHAGGAGIATDLPRCDGIVAGASCGFGAPNSVAGGSVTVMPLVASR